MKKKVLMVGLFEWDRPNAGGGEVTKPRNVYNYLVDSMQDECSFYQLDFFHYRHRPLALWAKLQRELKGKNACFIFPAGPNGSLFFFLFFKHYFLHHKISVYYPIVGGWLAEFLQKHKKLIPVVGAFKGCFAETRGFCQKLTSLGLKNIFYSPVFSAREPISIDGLKEIVRQQQKENVLKFCTFSRVMEEKGVTLAIKAIVAYNQRSEVKNKAWPMATLDIYGHLDKKYETPLQKLVSSNPTFIHFVGTLKDEAVITTLSAHFACLFPTYFFGEGFPASLLECYMSGLPVFASDWVYNSELVHEGVTGKLYPPKDQQALLAVIVWSSQNRETVENMRLECRKASAQFTKVAAMSSIVELLKKE
jgi:glycosyltransferase involved in cell wall biosynthesis